MEAKYATLLFRCLGGLLLAFILAAAGGALAAVSAPLPGSPQIVELQDESGALAGDPRVVALLAELDRLQQQAPERRDYNRLGTLSAQATKLLQELRGTISVLQAQLEVLDQALAQESAAAFPAAPEGATGAETAAQDVSPTDAASLPPRVPDAEHVARLQKTLARRARLNHEKEVLGQQVAQLEDCASTLSVQLDNLRRTTMETRLRAKSPSIAGRQFWGSLSDLSEEDRRRFSNFAQEMKRALQTTLQSPWRGGSLVVLALVLAVFGCRVLERGAVWLVSTHLPDGRLRRSFFAMLTVLGTFAVFYAVAYLLVEALGRHDEMPLVKGFLDRLLPLSGFCAVVAGLGRAILSSRRPSWRISSMPDEVADALRCYPALLAWLLLLGSLARVVLNVTGMGKEAGVFADVTGMSMTPQIFVRGISALLVVLWFFALLIRASRARKALAADDAAQGKLRPLLQRASPLGLLRFFATVLVLAIALALLGGYISLAHFLLFVLVRAGMLLLITWLLLHLVDDACSSISSGQGGGGPGGYLKLLLGVDDLQLNRMAVVLSAIGRLGVLALALLTLTKGGFGLSEETELVGKVARLFGEEGLGWHNISLQNLFNTAVVVVAGIWILRRCVRWLQQEYFPTTTVAEGIRASVLALCLNLGYVLVILVALSVLGLQWNNLAWIVSALSVGIGFGLQEIVKNFISGIILLTERPVKVGDLVSVNGIEGDIRRINVRATEIQLSSDRSTMIVPNSTLLSNPVRNATMDNASGVVSLGLVFPLDTDMTLACRLLLEVLSENTSVLDVPAPSVAVSQISKDGIALSATGYVSSPRMIGRTRSHLLLAVLEVMRAHGIAFSTPSAIAIERMPPAQPAAGEAPPP